MSDSTTSQLRLLLERMHAGDESARDELIARAYERLRRLTSKLLRDYPRVQEQESTGDILHEAFPRLRRALEAVPPSSVEEFFRLAALQIRRELLDLARGCQRRPPALPLPTPADGDGSASAVDGAPAASTYDPAALERWREFHEWAGALPEDERAVFDLLYYCELTQEEAAAALRVSVPTIKRRWAAARLRLGELLGERSL